MWEVTCVSAACMQITRSRRHVAFFVVSEQCCRVWTSSSLSCGHRSDLQLHCIALRPSDIRHLASVMNSLLLFRKVITISSTQMTPALCTKGCLVRACHFTKAHIQQCLCIEIESQTAVIRLTSSRFCAGLASARQPCVA